MLLNNRLISINMKKYTLYIVVCLIGVSSFSCKKDDPLATGTTFPVEFHGVWEADSEQDPNADGIFAHFETDTVTFIGRVGEVEEPFCYLVIPVFAIQEYEGDLFTVEILGLEEKQLGELKIVVNKESMEWTYTDGEKVIYNKRNSLTLQDMSPVCENPEKSRAVNELKERIIR